MGIQGMVTRTGWDGKTWGANQRITVDEAIRVNTINGAYNSHEEAIKGSITAGKLADFVVLADDPHTVMRRRSRTFRSCGRWWGERRRIRGEAGRPVGGGGPVDRWTEWRRGAGNGNEELRGEIDEASTVECDCARARGGR